MLKNIIRQVKYPENKTNHVSVQIVYLCELIYLYWPCNLGELVYNTSY